MNSIIRITKNISTLFISQVISFVLGFIALTYTARYLGVENFGILSLALAITGVFTVFIELGMDRLIIREVACDYSLAKNYTANSMFLRIILSLITLGVIFLITKILNYNQITIAVILIISIYMILNTFLGYFYSIFQAFEQMEYQSIGIILTNVILLLGVLLAIHYNWNLIKFSTIYVIMAIITLSYGFIVCYWKFFPPTSLKSDKLKELIKEAWPFAITNMSTNIYIWVDTILLSLIQGQIAVGLYNASYRLILVIIFIPMIFYYTIYPVMSKYYSTSNRKFQISFEKTLKILMIIAIPIGIGTTLVADKVISFLYGYEYLGSVIILQILIWSAVLTFIKSPFGITLEASRKQLKSTKIIILTLILNIILNIIIIPKYSYVGAGIVLVITDIIGLSLLIMTTRSEVSITKNIQINLIKVVIASLIMGIAIEYFINLNIFLIILIGLIIYSVTLIFLKVIDKDEILMIKSNIFSRKDN